MDRVIYKIYLFPFSPEVFHNQDHKPLGLKYAVALRIYLEHFARICILFLNIYIPVSKIAYLTWIASIAIVFSGRAMLKLFYIVFG